MTRRFDTIDANARVQRLRGRRATMQRLRRLRAEPLCRLCLTRNIIRVATTPDHIRPLSQGGSDDDDNIRCLCVECHTDVTAEQFKYTQRQRVDDDGWPP